MENRNWLILGICALSACSSPKLNTSSGRGPASVGQVPLKVLNIQSELLVRPRTVQVCGLTFEEPNYQMKNQKLRVAPAYAKLQNSPFGYPVPFKIEAVGNEVGESVHDIHVSNVKEFSYTPSHPILPDLPITSDGINEKLCKSLKSYHAEFLQAGPKSIKVDPGLTVRTYQYLQEIQEQHVATRISNGDLQTPPAFQPQLLIVYDDLYREEAVNLATIKGNLGYQTITVAVSELPGIHAKGPTPPECEGDYLKECYHYWGDVVKGVSQRAVPSLKGFHAETKIYEQYERVSFVPGLIRAYIRKIKNDVPLKGVILIGNDKVVAPFHLTTAKYDNGDLSADGPRGTLHTDIFYMIPDVPLKVQTRLHHTQIMPFMMSCKDSAGKIRSKYWCDASESRVWSDPALKAYRWSPYVPVSRTFVMSKAIGSTYFQELPVDSIIPVGRIPTQEFFLGEKDSAIAHYIEKVERWHRELPPLSNTSVFSTGGTTNDEWIFTLDDNRTFKATYGSKSHVYASEFFVPLSKCEGCVYKDGPYVLDEVGSRNRAAFFVNGHGGHGGVQAPFANGNVSSQYQNEYFYGVGGLDFHIGLSSYPTSNTLKVLENKGKLIGQFFANSCELSDFNLDNGIYDMMKGLDHGANERSFAEQLLTTKNAGPLNVYTNSDVGWSSTDNSYNVMFMNKIKIAWQNCGTIGDAYRLLVQDMLKGSSGGASTWQLYNRQMLGSPLNKIAQPHLECFPNIQENVEDAK